MRGWFGETFQSTVVRPTAIASIGGVIAIALIAFRILGDDSPPATVWSSPIQVALFCAFAVLGYSCLGFLVGWGIAHWRFATTPARFGSFWLAPAIAGILLYSSLLVMIAAVTGGDLEYAGLLADPAAAVIFLVSTAFMGVLASLFFRYALNFTALARGRENS